MKSKFERFYLWAGRIAGLALFPVLVGCLVLVIRAQDAKPGATSSTPSAVAKTKIKPAPGPPAAPAASSVPLTEAEGLQLDNNQLKMENLRLQAQQLQQQIREETARLTKERGDFVALFALSHNVDLTKFQLDPVKKAFVPILEKGK